MKLSFVSRLTSLMMAPVLALSLMFSTAPAFALSEAAAKEFVQGTIDRLMQIITDDSSISEKRGDFRDLLAEKTVSKKIAQFSASSAWRDMSDEQIERYHSRFIDYIASVYTDQFAAYQSDTTDIDVSITNAVEGGKKGIFVVTEIAVPGDEPINVEWRVSDRSGQIGVVDITVEGVSMLITQRSEFSSMLDRNNYDIEAFLKELKELSQP